MTETGLDRPKLSEVEAGVDAILFDGATGLEFEGRE